MHSQVGLPEQAAGTVTQRWVGPPSTWSVTQARPVPAHASHELTCKTQRPRTQPTLAEVIPCVAHTSAKHSAVQPVIELVFGTAAQAQQSS
jgi:hypothetical protein